jgi:hypothetical protein
MTGYLLSTVGEHFCHVGIAPLCIEHCVVQVILGPIQLEVFLDERGAISISGVDLVDCITLGRATTYQSVDLVIARGIEECTEDILAIAEKILRPSAHAPG